MNKFKVGDRVYHIYWEEEMTITNVFNSRVLPYGAKTDDGRSLETSDEYLVAKKVEEPKMKFIFEDDKKEKEPTFEDVEDNQFFVDCDGDLCQRDGALYNRIADRNGKPDTCSGLDGEYIGGPVKLLPKVYKIEF